MFVSYHVEVKPAAPIEQVVNNPQVAGKGADSPSGTMAANDYCVPIVRMQLTHSLKLPPNASMCAEVQLVGEGKTDVSASYLPKEQCEEVLLVETS